MRFHQTNLFERFMLFVILVNCVFMAIDDDANGSQQKHRVVEKADVVFIGTVCGCVIGVSLV